jgi:hypothetical protein
MSKRAHSRHPVLSSALVCFAAACILFSMTVITSFWFSLEPGQKSALDKGMFVILAILSIRPGIIAMTFRCPHCKNLFFLRENWGNPFARQCVHCGLGYKDDDIEKEGSPPV